jgi:hypothetical protein
MSPLFQFRRSHLGVLFVVLAATACNGTRQTASLPPPPATSGDVDGREIALDEVIVTGYGAQQMAALEPSTAADQMLVRSAALTIEAAEADEALEQARQIVISSEGYVSAERSNQMTLRIPNERLEPVMDQLSALGSEVQRDVRAVDVTAEYSDLQIQLENLRALQARLRTLLERAETVQDILAVESELARVTSQLERLEGRMRLMDNQVTYATLNFAVREPVRPGPLGWVFYGLYEAVKWLFVWD